MQSRGRLPKIKENPPLIYHWRELGYRQVRETAFTSYRETMQEDRRLLLDHYELMDIAIKVVGVGSVGTWCGMLLLMASEKDPLFPSGQGSRSLGAGSICGKEHLSQPRPAVVMAAG